MTLNFKVSRDFVRLALFTSFLCAATQASAITLLGGDGNFYRKTTTKLGYVKKIALVNDLSAEGISIAWATYDYNAKTFFGKLTPSQSGVLEAFSAAPIKKASINVYRNVHAVVVPANPLLPVILIETNPRAENYEQLEQGGFEKYQYQPLSRLNFELQPKSAWFDSDDTKYVPGCAGAISTSDRWGQLFSLTPIDIKHFGLIAATGLSEKELRNFAAPQCWSDGTFLLYSRIYTNQHEQTNRYQIIRSGLKNESLTTTVLVSKTDGINCFPIADMRRYGMCTEYFGRTKSEGLTIVDFEKKSISPVKGLEKFYPSSVILVGFSLDSSRAYFYKYKSPRNGLPQFISVNISDNPVATIENLPEGLRVVSAFDE